MLLSTWDFLIQFLWFSLPVIAIVKFKGVKGVIFGALAFWIIGILEGFILAFFDPARPALVDSLWIIIGFPAGLVYSLAIFVVYSVLRFIWTKVKK